MYDRGMASFAVWSSRGTLFMGLLSGLGCSPEGSHYGPPQTADTSTLSQGGAGGAGGSTGGAGGLPNACECAYEAALGQPDCADCINALKPNGKCVDQVSQCEGLVACLDIVQCPVKCNGKTGAALDECVNACFAAPANEQAYGDFKDVMACVCTLCSTECSTKQAVTCP